MENFLYVICSSPLFRGIPEEEVTAMLSCLEAKTKSYHKDTFLMRVGDITDCLYIVLSGSILIMQEDIWGNRNIVSKADAGQTFAAAYACAPNTRLSVNVIAETPVTVMLINVKRILNICPSACARHNGIIKNLLCDLAEKNLRFNEKLTHMGQRTTRAKLMSYFSSVAQRLASGDSVRANRKGDFLVLFRDRSGAVRRYSIPHARKKSSKNALFSVLRIFAEKKSPCCG